MSAIDPALVELMASAAYEASRRPQSSRPAWRDCADEWRIAGRHDMTAALTAAKNAGWRIERG